MPNIRLGQYGVYSVAQDTRVGVNDSWESPLFKQVTSDGKESIWLVVPQDPEGDRVSLHIVNLDAFPEGDKVITKPNDFIPARPAFAWILQRHEDESRIYSIIDPEGELAWTLDGTNYETPVSLTPYDKESTPDSQLFRFERFFQ